jgi:hypothetical protein
MRTEGSALRDCFAWREQVLLPVLGLVACASWPGHSHHIEFDMAPGGLTKQQPPANVAKLKQ